MQKVKKDAIAIAKNPGRIYTSNCMRPIIPTGIDIVGGSSHLTKLTVCRGGVTNAHKAGLDALARNDI